MKTFATSGLRAYSVDQMRLLETVIFTSSGTFDPADYSYGGALRVWVQGGGGGAGGWSAASPRSASGGGGGGCVYQEMIKGASNYWNEPNTVTVGLGGAGATLDNVAATSGGNSSFIKSISGGGLTAYGGGGSRGYLSDYSHIAGGGGASGDSGTVYRGGQGGIGKTDSGLSNCGGNNVRGVGGSGGIMLTSAAKYLSTTISYHHDFSVAGSNFEGVSGNMTPTMNNTGSGGSATAIACRPGNQGYGSGGDSGIVIVEVWG